MSTSTQPEGTETNPSENTSEQSHDETEIPVPDKYQIVAVVPVEFFTTERLNLARDNHKSNHSEGVEDLEKARVRNLEGVIKNFTNFDFKVYAEQISMGNSNQIDMTNHGYHTDEAIELVKGITNIVDKCIDENNLFNDILSNEFIEKAKYYISEFFNEDEDKLDQYLCDIHEIIKKKQQELRDLMKYDIDGNLSIKLRRKDRFYIDLKRQLKATISKDDEVTNAQIDLLIAEAKVNIETKTPINEIFKSRYRMSRDLLDVNTVLRNAKRELSEVTEYYVEDSFWDKLKQNLRDVTPKNNDNIVTNIEELITEAKNNIETKKPINEIFGNRHGMPKNLPDVNTVLRDAEEKIYKQPDYSIEEDFWDKLKQNLETVTPKDDNVAIAQINLLIAQAKANVEAKKPINEIFRNRYKILRTVLRDAEKELHEYAENNVKEEFWDELKQKLRDVTPKNDENIVANIEELIAQAKNNIEAKKPINKIFGNRRRMSRDLPDVRTVLRDAEKELHEYAENNVKEEFWDELKQKLRDVTPKNDENIVANIEELIAQAKNNIEAKKPINKIFGNRRRMSRDLPDVRTVLRNARRELNEYAENNVKEEFWDELKQKLEAVSLKDDNVAIAQINLLIAQAKANVEAKKPINEIFEDRHRMSRDLPDVHTVLRGAEKKMYKQTEYLIKEDFWDELKQKLEAVSLKDDNVAIAQINLLIAQAKANVEAKKPIREIFEDRHRMSRDLPDVNTVLRETERKLHEHIKYHIEDKFWDELKIELRDVISPDITPENNKNTIDNIEELIVQAKANMEAKKPITEIFRNRYGISQDLPDMHAVFKKFKNRINISYIKDKSELNNFISSLKKELGDLDTKSEIYSNVNDRLEILENNLASFEKKLHESKNDEALSANDEKSILLEIKLFNKNDSIENNVNKVISMIESLQGNNTNINDNSSYDLNIDEIIENMYKKLNELYNSSAYSIDENTNESSNNRKNTFFEKLPKYLLIDEILKNSKSNLDARHVKSIDILAAIPSKKPFGNKIEEGTKTGIVLILIIDVDLEKSRGLATENFEEIGKLFLKPNNVATILNLVFNKFFPRKKSSKFNEWLDNKSKINYSSILHIISCPDFAFRLNEDGNVQELEKECEDLIEKFIPEYSTHDTNQENSELNFIPRKNLKLNGKSAFSSALISYSNRLLAIIGKTNSFAEDGVRIIGLQIVAQLFLQRLSQFNDVLMPIAIDENRESLLDDKDSDKFNHQLHYTYTVSDELINLSVQDPDAVALRKLLGSTTIANQIAIFEERRKAFFSIKEDFEKQKREEKTDIANKRIQIGIFVLTCITIMFSILELIDIHNCIKLLIAPGIISLLTVILMWKFGAFKKIKPIYTNVKSKIFSRTRQAVS